MHSPIPFRLLAIAAITLCAATASAQSGNAPGGGNPTPAELESAFEQDLAARGSAACGARGNRCADGAACDYGFQCASAVCANNLCVAASCADGVRNQDESGVDCGGACSPCAAGIHCRDSNDCAQGTACVWGTCSAPGTCSDGKRNGRETGIDCGGDSCVACGGGMGCVSGKDCLSGRCVNNACTAPEGCLDSRRNGQETDLDCGGPHCLKCGEMKLCNANTDCQSDYCSGGVCRTKPRTSPFSDFVDTRMNFTLTNENFLAKPGETNPNVPGFRIGRPNQLGIMFFDNYDTRFTGYENLTHIVLYKKFESGRFEAEASMALRLLQFTDVNVQTIDDSSYLRLAIHFDPRNKKKGNVSLTAFPISADRLRLGYSYRLSWGGSPIFFKFNPDLPASSTPPVNNAPAPGARVQYTDERITAWFAFKTSTLLDKNPNVADLAVIYGLLGGVAVDAWKDHLRLEINGGFFNRGNNPNFYPTQQVGPGVGMTYPDFPVHTFGGSFQISAWNRLPPSLSIDYMLYRNDPTGAQRFFALPRYTTGFSWLAQSEVTMLASTLQDFDRPTTTTYQLAYAWDVNLRLQYYFTRVKLDASLRSLEFMLVNQPSLVPYASFPEGSDVKPEFFVSAGFDYHVAKIGLTLGPTVGVNLPANITPKDAPPQLCGNVGGSLCTPSTLVIRGEGDYSILPLTTGGKRAEVLPQLAAKLVLREDFLEFFAAILDLYYSYDPNQTILRKAADGTAERQFNDPHRLGLNITLQARF